MWCRFTPRTPERSGRFGLFTIDRTQAAPSRPLDSARPGWHGSRVSARTGPARTVAAGVALTALASRVFFKETITPVMMLGLGLIIGGVLLIELGAAH